MLIAQPGLQDIERLAAFLESPQRPEGTLSYLQTRGFLYAIATAPELVQPSEWLPVLFADGNAGFVNEAEANAILGTLMSCYNLAAEAGRTDAPVDLERVGVSIDSDQHLHEWSSGFAEGIGFLTDCWDAALNGFSEEIGESFEVSFLNLTVWIDPAARQKRLKLSDAEMAKLLDDSREHIAGDLRMIGTIGTAAYEGWLRERDISRHVESGLAVSRNAPCPCGSGKKDKKCCLAN